MSEPVLAPPPLTVYTVIGQIQEIATDYFTVDGIGARFYCQHTFLPYDKVKVTIQKVPPDAKPE